MQRLHSELPDTPLLIAEYGIGTDNDTERSDYLTAGLEIVKQFLKTGVDIRGFFHWTAVDNYEWLHGYDLQFGIITSDRILKPSAEVLRRVAKQ